MNIKWFKVKWKRFLLVVMAGVVMTATMTNRTTRESVISYASPGDTTGSESEPFFPDFPNQTRIGKPAEIPRRFLVEEADACLRAGDDVEVVAYVHSAISRVEQRRQTRLTWASADTPKMVVVFMVGRAKNDEEREILRRESELYHDIVQGDYGDHYNLLSYKALNALYWVTRNCPHVPWTLHVDDDLLIDTFMLQKFIEEYDNSRVRDMFHCRLLAKLRVLRKGRWRVTRREMSFRRYPPFCQGTMWLLPTKEVPRLLEAVPFVKYLWVDDAYVTGMLAKKARLKISPIPINRFGVSKYSDEDIGEKVAWFHVHNRTFTDLWPLILDHYNATYTL